MLFIADFFVNEIAGGGELCSEEIFTYLNKLYPNKISKVNCHLVTNEILKSHLGETLLISNFMRLSEEDKHFISDNFNYFIVEHDHKFCAARNPLAYPHMVVPEQELRNVKFYERAKGVLTQSKSHAELVQGNLGTFNVVNLGCNLWASDAMKELEKRLDQSKTRKIGIMHSNNPIKGTRQAIELCEIKGLKYELIPEMNQKSFWDELAKTETIIFLPQTYETYSRFAIEAKILGCKMVTNKAIGAMSEDYYHLNGRELFDVVSNKKKEVLESIDEMIKQNKAINPIQPPMVSLITTIFKGSKFVNGYLEAFKSQTYSNKELIIIDANSPENEGELIHAFKNVNPNLNIRYYKFDEKFSTSRAFNLATEMAKGEFISTVMIDDRIGPNYMKELAKQLTLDKGTDLVYADCLVSLMENEPFTKCKSKTLCEYSLIPFSKEAMIKNIQGPLPMYRKSVHEKIGGYREHILHGADWDFAIRLVKSGSVFRKVDKVLGSYYNNPNGLSTSTDPSILKERRKSEAQIFEEHKEVYPENYKKFKSYFEQWSK